MPTSDLLKVDAATLLDLLSDAVLVVDASGRILFANAAAPRLFGYTKDALCAMGIEELVPVEARARHAQLRADFLASPEPRRMGSGPGLHAVRADGSTVPVDISLEPVEGGTGPLVLACIRDMTASARLLEAAERAEERYRMVVHNASEVFYRIRIVDDTLRGEVEFVSPQARRLTGLEPEAFVNDPSLWIESVHPEDRATLFETTRAILASGVEGSRYYRLRNHETGEYRWMADRVVPLFDEGGRLCGHQGVARDITERRRSEEERQQLENELRIANKMDAIGRLAGEVAHDFNNLVSVVLTSCSLARTRGELSADLSADLEQIEVASRLAARLTRQLLTVSHEDQNAPVVIDLNEHIPTSASRVVRTLQGRAELVLDLADGVWPVRVDPGQLDQILLNIAANARDAMADTGGRFSIATANVSYADEPGAPAALPGDYVCITFSDTGVGMDAATLAHAFEPFFTTKPQGKGTGLGLASVYGIVKQNRGEITIESAPGQGTTVVIHFPRWTGAS